MHVLHRDVVGVGRLRARADVARRRLAEVEHLHDVGVRQADRELGLVDEHVDEVLAARELGQDPLDDEDLLEALDAIALGLEDLRHAALPEALEQAIATECGVHRIVRAPLGTLASATSARDLTPSTGREHAVGERRAPGRRTGNGGGGTGMADHVDGVGEAERRARA